MGHFAGIVLLALLSTKALANHCLQEFAAELNHFDSPASAPSLLAAYKKMHGEFDAWEKPFKDLPPGTPFTLYARGDNLPELIFRDPAALKSHLNEGLAQWHSAIDDRIRRESRFMPYLTHDLLRAVYDSGSPYRIELRRAALLTFDRLEGRISIDPKAKGPELRLPRHSGERLTMVFRSEAEMRSEGPVLLEEEASLRLSGSDSARSATRRLSETSDSKSKELLDAHLAFLHADGVLEINPESEQVYFEVPEHPYESPRIVLKDENQLLDGSYEHELKHFQDWFRVKRKLLKHGHGEEVAHAAQSEYELTPSGNARVIEWTEEHATESPGSHGYGSSWGYPQFEAINRLEAQPGFATKLRKKGSAERNETLDYMKTATRRLFASFLERGKDGNQAALREIRSFEESHPKNAVPRPRTPADVQLVKRYLGMPQALDRFERWHKEVDQLDTYYLSMDRFNEAPRKAVVELFNSREMQTYRNRMKKLEIARYKNTIGTYLRRIGFDGKQIRQILSDR
jgi:hypothetical protein